VPGKIAGCYGKVRRAEGYYDQMRGKISGAMQKGADVFQQEEGTDAVDHGVGKRGLSEG
jgi:hypothetical protein